MRTFLKFIESEEDDRVFWMSDKDIASLVKKQPHSPDDFKKFQFGEYLAQRMFKELQRKFNPGGNLTPHLYYHESEDILQVRDAIGHVSVIAANNKEYRIPAPSVLKIVKKHFVNARMGMANHNGGRIFGHVSKDMVVSLEDFSTGSYELMLPISAASKRISTNINGVPALEYIVESFLLNCRKVRKEVMEIEQAMYRRLNPDEHEEENWTTVQQYLQHTSQDQWSEFQRSLHDAWERAKKSGRSVYITNEDEKWTISDEKPGPFIHHREIKPSGDIGGSEPWDFAS